MGGIASVDNATSFMESIRPPASSISGKLSLVIIRLNAGMPVEILALLQVYPTVVGLASSLQTLFQVGLQLKSCIKLLGG